MWRYVLLAFVGAHVSVNHRASHHSLRHSDAAAAAQVRFARRNATANSSNSSNASPTPQPHVDWAQDKEYE